MGGALYSSRNFWKFASASARVGSGEGSGSVDAAAWGTTLGEPHGDVAGTVAVKVGVAVMSVDVPDDSVDETVTGAVSVLESVDAMMILLRRGRNGMVGNPMSLLSTRSLLLMNSIED